MIGNLSHVMTLANSIIGVSVLAMPFCFKQCGIVLATLVLLVSSVLSRLACHFLIKSAVMSRRRNFEFLAFHAFGRTGKFLVELFIIGFLVGTCIAFFVVVGDLGPQIVGKILMKKPEDIRTSLLVTTGTFIVLPLGLLRNIDSLSSVCTATIGFYLCLVVKVIAEAARHIFLGDWYDHVAYWRPAGILQCLPIFAMALFCQTQLFEIYDAIPNVCLDKMNRVVRGALNICTIVYLCVGFFGYVAFCTQPFTGNILLSFEPSLTSELIKMGFVFSVAFSFPLVIFPCRASLNSLLFRRAHTHEPSNYYIPEMRFRCLTLTIVAMSLGTGILMPNIEFVLGIVGSTIGVMICLIFPAAFFIAISTKNTNERLIAQAILFVGMWIMVLGTYANLYAMEESSSARSFVVTGKPPVYSLDRDNVQDLNGIPREAGLPFVRLLPNDVAIIQDQQSKEISPQQQQQEQPQQAVKSSKDFKEHDEAIDVRREPPIPVERAIMTERAAIDASSRSTTAENIGGEIKKLETNAKKMPLKNIELSVDELAKAHDVIGGGAVDKKDRSAADTVRKNDDDDEARQERPDEQRNENLIDSEAIKKEESELAAAGDLADIESAAARHEKLRQTLEKHKLEQLEMMQEQKEILKDIKEEKEDWEMEKKRLAMEQRKKQQQLASNSDTVVDGSSVVPSVNGVVVDQANRRSAADEYKQDEKLREKSVSVNDTTNREAPKSNGLDSLGIIPIVEADKSRGPILNALTNWTSKRNVTSNEKPSLVTNEDGAPSSDRKIEIEAVKKKLPLEYALPIALQMNNQTKEGSERRRNNRVNGDNDAAKRAAAELVDRADRLKREAIENSSDANDIREALASEKRENEDFRKDSGGSVVDVDRRDRDGDQCQQKDGKSESFISREASSGRTRDKTAGAAVSSSTITAKSIVYLSEQSFVDKIPSLGSSSVDGGGGGQVDLSELKKRDLKALNQDQ